MEKEFNITGICRPRKHYAADVSAKLAATLKMVERGDYFIINRPRQYGKTTMLYTLETMLMATSEYLVFNISFEGIGDDIFDDEQIFAPGFIRLLIAQTKYSMLSFVPFLKDKEKEVYGMQSLSDALTEIVVACQKKVVVLIDEVDKSSNNQLFVSFLAMLRNKYLEQDRIPTFHAVVLAGLHDVKTLKAKIRPDAEQKYNSPWNIATEYKVDMNLYPHEIKPMLDEYAHDKGVTMDTQHIAERLFYYTSGYPFLVSRLCKMLDEDFLPEKTEKTWTDTDLEQAVRLLVQENNTNFESLTKNIENNPDLYDLVYRIAVGGDAISFNILVPTINLGVLYGIIVNRAGRAAIHSRIYGEVIGNYMTGKMEVAREIKNTDIGKGYKNPNVSLNMEAVMLGFQTFMKKEYSRKDRDFLEKHGRLVFLAFIKPIINGSGYDFKEPQISDEKRLDVVITYLDQKHIAELKLWRGEKAHEKGLEQLHDYLDTQNLDEGYLLIFDHSEVKNWHSEWIEVQEKRVLAVWV